MDIERRIVLAGGVALAASAALPADAAELANPFAAFIAPDGSSVKAIKVSMDGGETNFASVDVPADNSPYPLFKQLLTHKANRVALYSAPAGHKAAVTADGKQLILLVAGGLTLAAKGAKQSCKEGETILLDPGAAHEHHAGPAGYTAIRVALAD